MMQIPLKQLCSAPALLFAFRMPLLENDRYPTVQLMPVKNVKNIGLLFSNSTLYSDIVF